MATDRRTALVVPIPDVDPLLADVARHHPLAARPGVPAHVTVLIPFLSGDAAHGPCGDELAVLFGSTPAVEVEFGDCSREGGFVFLVPQPVEPFAALTQQVRSRWPALVPYDGVYGDTTPHLTVATRTPPETAEAVERDAAAALPIVTRASEAWWVEHVGEWRLRRRFPFAT